MLRNTLGPTSAANVAMMARTTRISMRVKPERSRDTAVFAARNSLALRDTEHLLHRREPGLDLGPAIGAHRTHPSGARDLAKLGARCAAYHCVLELIGHPKELENP